MVLARSVWNQVQLSLVGMDLVKTKIIRKPEITLIQGAVLQFFVNQTSNGDGHRRRKLSCGVFYNLLATSY
jgi:hypothetical protein